MRMVAGVLLLLLLLTACGAPVAGDGVPATAYSVPAAGNVASTAVPLERTATPESTSTPDPNATATRTTPTTNATTTRGTTATTRAVATAATPGRPTALGTPLATPGTPRAAVGQPRTLVQIVAPYRPAGLVASLQITETAQGYCLGGSQSLPGRPDAWRCSSGGRTLDPCFAATTPDTQPLACLAEPWATTATLLNLTAPLPRAQANTTYNVTHTPWGLELADGLRCRLTTGGGTLAGLPVIATCPGDVQIVGEPDRSGGRWLVFVARPTTITIEQVEVSIVWY